MRYDISLLLLCACGSVRATNDAGGVADDAASGGFALTVAVTGSGAGRITGTGIDCGIDCMESYAGGTTVVLHAAAAPGSIFVGWSGAELGCPGQGDCSLVVASTAAVTAEFAVDIDPSNHLSQYLDMTGTGPDIDLPDGTIIDTTGGSITTPTGAVNVASAIVAQVNAPSIRVFIVRSAVLNDVQVSGTRAFALVSSGLITVQGKMTAAGRGVIPGPGVGVCASAAEGGGQDGVDTGTAIVLPGGGGGGYGSSGARGGDVSSQVGGVAGQALAVSSNVEGITPLRGGCAGGGTLFPAGDGDVQDGAAGGGAVQLTSRTQVSLVTNSNGTAIIDVGGGGGRGGAPATNPRGRGGGGGGGAGGAVLIEAPRVFIGGTGVVVAAAGGGGGGGCAANAQDGRIDGAAAAGGDCIGNTVLTSGGAGAVVRFPATTTNASAGVTGTATSGDRASGGGGGGSGRIRINTDDGNFNVGTGASLFAQVSVGVLGKR